VIRQATADDAGTVEAICAACYPQSHWVGVADYSASRVRETVAALAESDEGAVFFSGGGAIAVIRVPLWFSEAFAVSELFFWALDGAGAALRAAAEQWAADKADIVLMGAHEPGRMAAVSEWYRRGGYVPHGRTYRKVLSHGT
jgi:nucleotide-binding universal stress UspA family protein